MRNSRAIILMRYDLLKYLLGLLFCILIIFSFISPRPVEGYGDEFRIFYYHVPCAMVSFAAFLVNMIYSIKYLKSRNSLDDLKAACAAELGLIFGILATLTGAIFARLTWGVFWNWDIRQTTLVVLLAVYGAYLALRAAIDQEERRGIFSASYSIIAFAAVPTFGFIIPRLYPSLHPPNAIISQGRLALGSSVALIFFGFMLAYLLLFFWLFNLRWRMGWLEHIQKEKGYE